LTQPKTLFTKIYDKRDKDVDKYKLKKSKEPDMGTYDSPRAYKTTQIHAAERRGVRILPGEKKTFLDEAPKTTKFVPPPGHYKKVESGYKILSQSPRSVRMYRH